MIANCGFRAGGPGASIHAKPHVNTMRLLRTAKLRCWLQAVLVLALLPALASRASTAFPRPNELQRDVDFWVRVYTQIETSGGFVHDADNLAVVYETLLLSGQPRADEKAMREASTRYAGILERLASKPDSLNKEEARVLALWGAEVTPARLRQAAANVRFQRGQSERFLAGLERSGLWQGYIAKEFSARKLPPELAALPHVESSFNPNAYSSIGAAGLWQFTRSTGQRYLQIDYLVDERMDPYAATRAAAQLLEHNYQLTGSWPLAVTAYNHGASGMRRAARDMGTTDIARIVRDYKGRNFGFASRNFYVSFLAALEVSNNPSRYFSHYHASKPEQYAQLVMPQYLPAEAVANALKVNLDELKQANGALLEPVWTGKKYLPKGYPLRVPQQRLAAPAAQLLASIPSEQRFAKQVPDKFHTVVAGDSVSEIAARYGHSTRDIAAMNSLNRRYSIRVGQVLRLPLEGSKVMPVDTAKPDREALASAPAETDNTSGETAEQLAQELALGSDPSDYSVASDNSIEVQGAETLGHYADWLDLHSSQLRRLNGMRFGRPVVVGHRLKLDFSKVDRNEFERRRLSYQQDLQQDFFENWQIRTTRTHVIAPGESLWLLTQRQFKVPMWLLRQYNPELDPDKLHPGVVIVIPELVAA